MFKRILFLSFAFFIGLHCAAQSWDYIYRPGAVDCEAVPDIVRGSNVTIACTTTLPQDSTFGELGVNVSLNTLHLKYEVQGVSPFGTWDKSNVTINGLADNTTYYYRPYVRTMDNKIYYGDVRSFATDFAVKDYEMEYVDLGLSVKWATCNVGARVPEDAGDFFAWGETEAYYYCRVPLLWKADCGAYETHNWQYFDRQAGGITFRLKAGSSKLGMTYKKYSIEKGGKGQLESCDDAAHVNWGADWRMPTDKEMQELTEKCTFTPDLLNGVRGWTVRSTVNGNSIFIPAAGQYLGRSHFGAGQSTFLWTSTLSPSYSYSAWNLEIRSMYSETMVYCTDRYSGYPVRAVHP